MEERLTEVPEDGQEGGQSLEAVGPDPEEREQLVRHETKQKLKGKAEL